MIETQVIGFIVFVVGAIVGSFLNVCIVRMPLEKSIVRPRSHCVQCKKMIPWYDNIPFVSYILLLGKCRYCKTKISFRYFFIELLTAMSFVVFYYSFQLSFIFLAYLVMLCCFIVATFVDFEHRIIPDEISVGGMLVGLALSIFIPAMHNAPLGPLNVGRIIMFSFVAIGILSWLCSLVFSKKQEEKDGEEGEDDDEEDGVGIFAIIFVLIGFDVIFNLVSSKLAGSWVLPYLKSFDSAIIGALVGGGSIYVMGLLGDVIFKKESMGGGDVKLMALVGAFLGWELALLTFFLAPFFGAIYGIAEKIRTKDSAIAYGPFLVMGALISMFWGELIINYILKLHGLR